MPKTLFPNGRKRIVVYVGKIDYLHIEKAASGRGKVGLWIRKLIDESMSWKH